MASLAESVKSTRAPTASALNLAADEHGFHLSNLLFGDFGFESRVRAEERRRIGRELHDATAQLIVTLQLRVMYLKSMLDPSAHKPVVDDIEETLAELHREIRVLSLLHGANEPAQELLPSALSAMCEKFGRLSGVKMRVRIDHPYSPPRAEVGSAIFRIAQEALANVQRHSGASTVRLQLTTSRGFVRLSVSDNGIGIARDWQRSPSCAGLGLHNMMERARALGGALSVRRLNRGTRVSLKVPIAH